jgi:large subunit ribosomal protein L25
MSDIISLETEIRSKLGKGSARATRRAGLLPAIVYGGSQEPQAIAVDPRLIHKEMQKNDFFTKLLDLKIAGKTERVIPRDIQFDPVTDVPLHLDLMRVSKDSRITVSVPIHFLNEEKSPGIKRGGILNIVLHKVELSCLADEIPDQLTVDLTGLEIHDAIHLHDMKLPQNATALHAERDMTIATIVSPTKATKAEEAEENAAATEVSEPKA